MLTIDAKGQNCPSPVIMTKKDIEKGAKEFVVEVDNEIAVQNLQKLAESQQFQTKVEQGEGVYRVYFSGEGAPAAAPAQEKAPAAPKGNGYAVFVGKDYVGEGSHELGLNLIRMFFYVLTQSEDLPASVLFMNAGVKLPAQDEQVIEHLKVLADKGVEILVCGTCINYYQLPTDLQVGTISNMYDIVSRMQAADKVITV